MVEKTSVAFVYEQANISYAKLIIKSGLKSEYLCSFIGRPKRPEKDWSGSIRVVRVGLEHSNFSLQCFCVCLVYPHPCPSPFLNTLSRIQSTKWNKTFCSMCPSFSLSIFVSKFICSRGLLTLFVEPGFYYLCLPLCLKYLSSVSVSSLGFQAWTWLASFYSWSEVLLRTYSMSPWNRIFCVLQKTRPWELKDWGLRISPHDQDSRITNNCTGGKCLCLGSI